MQRREYMQEEVRKEEVQELLGRSISDAQFEEALGCARRKQRYIYERETRLATLQHWYLVKLTGEYVRSNAFSRFTMDLCRTFFDMEKEHQFNEHGAPKAIHILSDSAL